MPLVAHSPLPSFDRLRQRGQEVLTLRRALSQDIRELHIGLLNMMPDAALQITERQFMRLVGNCNQIAQFYVHVFSVPGLGRSAATQAYIDQYYTTFEQVKQEGLDALIITGANVANPSLDEEAFWQPLTEVIGWAREHVTSTLCSCLATHALLKYLHKIDRVKREDKKWGVFEHRVTQPNHPLLREINTRFDVPHSRWNDISRAQAEAAGLTVLIQSVNGDMHMAVSRDQLRMVYFQGHPEYDINSLLKEYKRDLLGYLNGKNAQPPYPENYFPLSAREIAERYLLRAQLALESDAPLPDFPEAQVLPHLDNTWGDTARAIFNNWLGAVYQVTNVVRHLPFDAGIDPDDPLNIL
ncbi:MAG: homoserine O-succinyltransferase [Chloroflexi bacterium]|nr:homoserine O-succinyltransferase [Chloroflexota bacterium]MCY3581613.1 homoserine O-succinyltransferase [Chloroflexota bacterium]MCY3717041.1 homoserine O-succinyltransferase [Chloroflexota bacterium]MDE2652138.1 homoserine O-succinyltransferase [Chloroflexota bacterium]MXX50593.1 homoserine O-succinyltransferase [Chloroflexota bacterium]